VAVLPFVVFNGLQALPHPTSVGADVVRFDLSHVLMLCLFDGLHHLPSLKPLQGFACKLWFQIAMF
jgi:hypothetical protein